MNVTLSLAQLEAFDPGGVDRGGERRFCCPLCGGDKKQDASHRSLAVNRDTGKWCCHRCGNAGVVQEHWEKKPRVRRRDRGRAQLREAFSVAPSRPDVEGSVTSGMSDDFRAQLAGLVKLAGTPGQDYLAGRGIPLMIASEAHVRYAAAWFGRSAVVFPVYDAAGHLVAAQARYCDDRAPKVRSSGAIRLGVFSTAGAWEAEPLILVEAAIDALTLASCGYPAVALCGAWNCPEWLPQACAFRRVLLALDGDDAGDSAAVRLAARLRPLGAQVERLRPCWFRDWNALEPRLVEGLDAALRRVME